MPETIRISVGLEHIDDIIEDLDSRRSRAAYARRPHAAE